MKVLKYTSYGIWTLLISYLIQLIILDHIECLLYAKSNYTFLVNSLLKLTQMILTEQEMSFYKVTFYKCTIRIFFHKWEKFYIEIKTVSSNILKLASNTLKINFWQHWSAAWTLYFLNNVSTLPPRCISVFLNVPKHPSNRFTIWKKALRIWYTVIS